MSAAAIDRLTERFGIAHSYRDQEGTTREIPDATKLALLSIFGVRVHDGDAARILAELERRDATTPAEPVVVLHEDAPKEIVLNIPRAAAGTLLHWRLTEESGRAHDGVVTPAALPLREAKRIGRRIYERRALLLPDSVPLGYHAIDIAGEGPGGRISASTTVIIVPQHAFLPSVLARGERLWGLALQLYGVRSRRNWGIGDFTDLHELLLWAGSLGAATIGINPLHALFLDDPQHISPYSPSSRLFINPLYLDVEAIDDFAASQEAQALVASDAFRKEVERLRAAPLVDYVGVTTAKRSVLKLLHRMFRTRAADDQQVAAFHAFRQARSPALEQFAIFNALREDLGADDLSLRDWRRWPPEYQSPNSVTVLEFARDNAEAVEFFVYLQWQAERQLARCLKAARRAGMSIGLYTDLAVGADAAGADAWAAPDLVAGGAAIGAPPDMFHQNGQNWGLPPINTAALRAQAFQPFVDLLRANMRLAGAVRIDHILGLQRLFWIPEGAKPAEGAYVAYPFDELIGLVALESQRDRCLVIGEDLGTVPEGFRQTLHAAGVLSYSLLYFERGEGGRFLLPHEYPVDSLVSITTHDLPTLWGYWSGEDIDERARIGAFATEKAMHDARWSRGEEIVALLDALRREGLIDASHPHDIVPFEAILRFIARTPSRLLMIGLDDLLGVREQANMPGTIHEHPNWRRKLPMDIEQLVGDEGVRQSARWIAEERSARSAAPGRTGG